MRILHNPKKVRLSKELFYLYRWLDKFDGKRTNFPQINKTGMTVNRIGSAISGHPQGVDVKTYMLVSDAAKLAGLGSACTVH